MEEVQTSGTSAETRLHGPPQRIKSLQDSKGGGRAGGGEGAGREESVGAEGGGREEGAGGRGRRRRGRRWWEVGSEFPVLLTITRCIF